VLQRTITIPQFLQPQFQDVHSTMQFCRHLTFVRIPLHSHTDAKTHTRKRQIKSVDITHYLILTQSKSSGNRVRHF